MAIISSMCSYDFQHRINTSLYHLMLVQVTLKLTILYVLIPGFQSVWPEYSFSAPRDNHTHFLIVANDTILAYWNQICPHIICVPKYIVRNNHNEPMGRRAHDQAQDTVVATLFTCGKNLSFHQAH